MVSTLTHWTALNSSSPPLTPGATLLLSPHPGTVLMAPHWTIKLWSQVQAVIILSKNYNSLHNDAGGTAEEQDAANNEYKDVLEFSAEEQTWKKVGSMNIERSSHAISVINYNSIEDYCN